MIDGEPLAQHRLALLSANSTVEIAANTQARCVVVGGESVGKRHKWWNFVSSRPERIEQAKQDWQSDRFNKVQGETEFIPLPEDAEVQPLS